MSEVRWGIIGVGDVCEVKSGPAFQKIKNSSLVGVMRRDGAKAQDYAQRHNVPKWFDNAQALIDDPEINAIYIATPPNVHEEYTKLAAQAGKPVYVEKPMARNHDECLRMVKVCKQFDVPLFVAFYRRSLPNFLKVKEILDQGLLGDIRYVKVIINKMLEPHFEQASGKPGHWRVDPDIAGGGYFYDLGSHQLDLLDFLLGPIEKAFGYSKNQAGAYAADDITVGSFYFKSGVIGQGIWCFNAGESSDEEITTIVGSKGEVSFSFFGDHTIDLKVEGNKTQHMKFDIPRHIQQPLIQTIVNELTGKGKCPSTGESGARAAWALDQICNRVD
ncbi:MAG: Gfo/Idh/MocA family oxidoreductase [Reichenbachiella sp.]